MASLGSKIKSSISSAAKKVTSSYGNATKQLQALGSSLNKTSTANSTSASTGKPAVNGAASPAKKTSVTTAKPATAPKANATSVYTGAPAVNPVASKANSTSASTGRPATNGAYTSSNMTSVATGKPSTGSIVKAGSGGGGNGMLASAYGALQGALGGQAGKDRASASDGRTDTYAGASSSYSPSTYKGTAGNSYTSYSAGQGQSLEAQGLMASGQGVPTQMTATPESRTANRGIVSNYEAGKNDREAQIAALTAQRDQLKAVYDSLAASQAPAADPNAPEEETEEQKLAKQIEAMEKQMDKLNEVPADVLAAQREEEALLAEEARIKNEMNQQLYGIKGQAIPQGFITGQGARVQDLANIGLDRIAGQKVTLAQKLANAQERRKAALDVVREKTNRLYDKQDTLSSRAYDEKKRKEDREADKEKDRYVTLSDGAQLYDTVTGKIVENAKNYAPKSSGGSSSPTSQANLAAGEAKLRASRGADGYADPTVYQTAFNEWPGTTAEFLSKFPPKNYVNPANTWLPAILRPTGSGRSID